jgi:hypothetical protein
MGSMGRYCKAYHLRRFREYSEWAENVQNLRKDRKPGDGEAEGGLTDDDIFYLHENYVVTDGIFMDENIIFDNTGPEWIEYCSNKLEFKVPVYEPIKIEGQEETAGSNA